ncbi:MAG: TonB-dependent receptor [Leptospiraceae bacterium]|nr:TonB-dependent receptor [Leptospiraceae bacterium]
MKPVFRHIAARGVFLLVVTLGLWPSLLAALEVQLQVVDPATRQPVAGAQVIVAEIRQKFRTNADGRVSINVPKAGFYTVRVITPAGKLVQPRLQFYAEGQQLTVYTGPPPRDQKPVPQDDTQTVQGNQSIEVQGLRRKQKVSRYQVRLDEIKRIPGQFGEALRGVETLPGINAPPFGNGEIVIRGANPDSNTYLVDRLPIGYAFHFFPLNSVLANDLIQTIDMYNGAYPANYGNATGGIIDITTIDEVDRFGGNVNFSIWAANVIFKAPMAFGAEEGAQRESQAFHQFRSGASGQAAEDADAPDTDSSARNAAASGSYWIAAVRGSYMDQTLKAYVPDGIELPVYYDGQFKARFQLTSEQALFLYFLGSKDTFAVEVPEQNSYDPTKKIDPVLDGAQFDTNLAFHTEALRHTWQPGSLLRNELTVLYHNNIQELGGQIGSLKGRFTREEGWAALMEEVDWVLMPRHIRLESGLEYRQFIYSTEGVTVRARDPNDESPNFYNPDNPAFESVPVDDYESVPYVSGFGMLTLAGYGFEFKPGFRYDYFGPTRQSVVDPRGTLSYEFPTKTTLFSGAGLYHKVPEPYQFSSTSGNPNLKMERAEQYAGGIEQVWNQWQFRLELFRNFYSDIVVADPYITTPWRENSDPYKRYTTPILYNDRLGYSNDGTGMAEGFEVYIKYTKKEEDNGFYGWISYTWSRTIRNSHQHILTDDEKNIVRTADELRLITQYDNTKDGYASFDRTHIINLIAGYKFNREWQVGGRWSYKTAPPFTDIIGDDGGLQQNKGRKIYDPKYSQLTNTRRLHPYHRLDLRLDRFFHYEWGYGNFYIEVLNAYVRKNELNQQWDNSRPYSKTNPSIQYDFLALQYPPGSGSKSSYLIPFFNVGLEMKF